MSSKPQSLNSAETQGESFTQTRQFEWLARGGVAARGVIYAIIGGLALQLALGDSGGSTTSQQGALREIAQQPFGEFLLILMAIGLAGYAIWKLVRAAIGHGKEATDSTTDRVSGAVSGILYAALCVTAVSILIGSQSSSGSSLRSSGSSFAVEPSTTSRKIAMAASRAGDDSRENGLSGDVGSAAVLKNVAANEWYGAFTSTPACRVARSRVAKSRSDSSSGATAPRSDAWLRS